MWINIMINNTLHRWYVVCHPYLVNMQEKTIPLYCTRPYSPVLLGTLAPSRKLASRYWIPAGLASAESAQFPPHRLWISRYIWHFHLCRRPSRWRDVAGSRVGMRHKLYILLRWRNIKRQLWKLWQCAARCDIVRAILSWPGSKVRSPMKCYIFRTCIAAYKKGLFYISSLAKNPHARSACINQCYAELGPRKRQTIHHSAFPLTLPKWISTFRTGSIPSRRLWDRADADWVGQCSRRVS